MTADLVLGVDPGLSGALALVELSTGALVDVLDMPVHRIGSKHALAEYELARVLDDLAARIVEAWLETPTPRPGQGVQSIATSLRNYGVLRGIIVANFVPVHDVAPATWKRAAKLSADKDESRAMAQRMFPGFADRFVRKGDDGRAEAVLIAAHGRLNSYHKPVTA